MLYFAAARDVVERESEFLELREGASAGDLKEEILRLHPRMRKLAGSIRLAVNLEIVESGATLREADEVGVIPPVAGG